LEKVTRGARGLINIPDPSIPAWAWVHVPNFFSAIGNGFIRFANWIWWGGDVRAIGKVRDIGDVEFGVDSKPYYYLLMAIILVMVFVLRRLNDSRIGRAWIAIREDEVAAEAMGVDTLKMKLLAFAIGAGVASFAGVVQATSRGFISPASFVVIISIQILAMVVLGGLGSIVGAMVGAAAIVVVPEIMRDPAIFKSPTLAQTVEEWRFVVFGAVLVAMMIFRPQGIVPSRRRAEELKRAPSEAAAPAIPTEMEVSQ
jgi:branched-chain amino acid transport system permease protein